MAKRDKNAKRLVDGVEPQPKTDDEAARAFEALSRAYDGNAKADLTRIVRSPRRSRRGLVIFLIASAFVIAAVAGFLVFTKTKRFTGSLVSVRILTPENVTSGAEVELTVVVENQEAVMLRRAQVAVRYPDGFTFSGSSITPSNDAKNAFVIGDIRSGMAKRLMLTGQIVGDIGSTHTFDATLSYVPQTFNSEFTAQTSQTVTLGASTLALTFDGPERAIPGTEVTYKLSYDNRSSEKVDGAKLSLVYPESFAIIGSDPAIDTDGTWTIRDLEAGVEGSVTVRGKFTGNIGTLQELTAKLGLIADDGTVQPQTETKRLVQLINPELSVSTAVNGSSSDLTTTVGSTLRITIAYANPTDEILRDVTAQLSLAGNLIDEGSLSAEGGPARDGTNFTWTKENVESLAELAPGAQGELRASATVRANITPEDRQAAEPKLEITATLRGRSDELGGSVEAVSTKLTVRLITQLSLQTEARYYAEDFTKLGSGPLPPRVGQTTKYRIYWKLSNTVNDVSDVTVRTTIPEGVFWTGRFVERSVGDIAFDTATRRVTWTINKAPAFSGSSGAVLTAGFEVSITPGLGQVGHAVELTGATAAKGHDDYADTSVTDSRDALTTNCDFDQYAQGQGIVQAAEATNGNTNTNAS